MILKYGYDSCVIIEDTHGEMDHKYLSRLRDGGALGSGNTPSEAIQSLIRDLRKTADDIEKIAVDWRPS